MSGRKLENVEDIYELSPMQQGMLFHTLYAPESGAYIEQFSFSLYGRVEIPPFIRAWQYVVDRHPVLRTSFFWEDLEKPLQVVHPSVTVPFVELDWRGWTPAKQNEELARYLKEDRSKGFELSQAPLLRLCLMHLSDYAERFVLTFHHILMDGWSGRLVMEEVATAHRAYLAGQEPDLERPRPYGDYIAWLQKQDFGEAEKFFRQMLKNFAAPTSLGIDRALVNQSAEEKQFDEQEIRLSQATTTVLLALARQHKLTVNTLIQGVWAILLSHYSGEQDVVFGAVVSGRPTTLASVEHMVGLFINTLPVRVQISPQAELLPWLHTVQAQQFEARQYEYSSLVDIQGWSAIPRGHSLFESILVFENYPTGNTLSQQPPSRNASQTVQYQEWTNYPLNLLVGPGADLWLKIMYNTARFDRATIQRLAGHFLTLVGNIIAHPEQRLGELAYLTEAEQNQILVDWNATWSDYPREICIAALVEAQVALTPEAVAVTFGSQHLTYRELNHRANQMAHYLKTLGVGPNSLVAISLERSMEMVVSLLGILKAGGAYVPIDPSYPHEQVAFMLQDTQVQVLVTQAKLAYDLPTSGLHVLRVDTDWDAITRQPDVNLSGGPVPTDLAYVIYTSGSTGQPKGVAMPHQPLVNLLIWQNWQAKPGKTLQFTSLSFDVSFQEIFSTWCSGGTLVMVSETVRRDPGKLLEVIVEHSIDRLFLPFSALQQLAEVAQSWGPMPSSLRKVITAGEQLQITPPIAALFSALKDCRLHNQYGPSETHVVTAFTLSGTPANWPLLPPIGRPLANTQIYILDPQLHPVPIGVIGELYIGGDVVARGYLNRPALTAERFIPDPFSPSPGERLYRTGDMARYLHEGQIEFLGRRDHQVKVRGFRIELGEVEAVLGQHPAVQQAVVIAREDLPGNKRLVAYVVPKAEHPHSVGQLRDFLKLKLPDFMVPSHLIELETMPLTPSGKVDRKSLPAPATTRPALEAAYAEPRTEIEEALAQIWAAVLGLDKVGLHDNFFELGGHSLLGTQLISRVRTALQLEVPLRWLFEVPTVAGLAERIEIMQWAAQAEVQVPGAKTGKDYEEGVL